MEETITAFKVVQFGSPLTPQTVHPEIILSGTIRIYIVDEVKSNHEQTSWDETNSKIIGIRNGITYRVDTTPENCTPEKIRQRLRTIAELAIAIGIKEGKLHSGLTVEQARDRWKQIDLNEKLSHNKAEDPIQCEPELKEIRIRLPSDIWNQIGMEARKIHISHTELARKWIINGLNKARMKIKS